MGEDSLLGLSVGQQLGIIAIVGVVLVVASYGLSSPVSSTGNPTVFGIGLVCLAYAVLRGGYELVFGG
jgi:di/tricarboxylate transporter